MAPVGFSLVNLLIESSSLDTGAEENRSKKIPLFPTKLSSTKSSPSTSPPTTRNVNFLRESDDGITSPFNDTSNFSSASSSPVRPSTPLVFEEATSPSVNNDGTNSLGSNNYFNSCKDVPNQTQKRENAANGRTLKALDEVKGEIKSSPASKGWDASNEKCSPLYKKFSEKAKQINSHLLPVWSLLSYPSDLHYYGRTAVMTVVTALVIEKSLENLPDIEQLGKVYGPYLKCNLVDGSDPSYPKRFGFDKDFF